MTGDTEQQATEVRGTPLTDALWDAGESRTVGDLWTHARDLERRLQVAKAYIADAQVQFAKQQTELASSQHGYKLLADQLAGEVLKTLEKIDEIDALKQRLEQSEKVLGMAKTQMAIARRFLPSHGSFGEEGISAYCLAQNRIDAALAAEPPTDPCAMPDGDHLDKYS